MWNSGRKEEPPQGSFYSFGGVRAAAAAAAAQLLLLVAVRTAFKDPCDDVRGRDIGSTRNFSVLSKPNRRSIHVESRPRARAGNHHIDSDNAAFGRPVSGMTRCPSKLQVRVGTQHLLVHGHVFFADVKRRARHHLVDILADADALNPLEHAADWPAFVTLYRLI